MCKTLKSKTSKFNVIKRSPGSPSRNLISLFTNLEVSLLRHHGQDDGLHGGDVAEAHLGDVEGAYHVGPGAVVGALQRPLAARAELAPLKRGIMRKMNERRRSLLCNLPLWQPFLATRTSGNTTARSGPIESHSKLQRV